MTTEETTRSVPRVISWNVTAQCNLRCRHCYLDASVGKPDELRTDEALRVLGEIAEVNRDAMLILSGGEPLCRPDLDALVTRAAAMGMATVLGTNGTLLSADRAHCLADRGLVAVGISLDSLVSRRHDEFRGMKGAWRVAIEGIESARRAGLEVQIQMTLNAGNVGELPQVVRFARDVGARLLTVFFLVCTGRGEGLADLSPEQYEQVLRSLAREPECGVMVRPRCAPTFRRVLAQTKPESILLESGAGTCMAGRTYCRITPNGGVTPCPYLPLVAGRLRERSFGEIWFAAPLLQALRKPILQGRCGACEYRELCGGCRARAFAANGEILAEDPWCTYVPGTDERPQPCSCEAPISWTAEAESRLEGVPAFARWKVRAAAEGYARRRGVGSVTPELLRDLRQTMRQRSS